MDIIYTIMVLWIIVGFIVTVFFGLLSDCGQHGESMIRAASRAKRSAIANNRMAK